MEAIVVMLLIINSWCFINNLREVANASCRVLNLFFNGLNHRMNEDDKCKLQIFSVLLSNY